MAQQWRISAPGFAVGPERVLTLPDGRAVTLSSYWTDEDGVCVNVDAGDGPFPARAAEQIAVAVIQMAGLPEPEPDLVAG